MMSLISVKLHVSIIIHNDIIVGPSLTEGMNAAEWFFENVSSITYSMKCIFVVALFGLKTKTYVTNTIPIFLTNLIRSSN